MLGTIARPAGWLDGWMAGWMISSSSSCGCAALDFIVGDVFRVSEEEQRFMLYDTNARFGGGSYALTPINILRQHSAIVDNLLYLLLMPTRLGRLEMHYSQREAARGPGFGGYNTYDVLNALAFGRSDAGSNGLLFPLARLVDAADLDATDVDDESSGGTGSGGGGAIVAVHGAADGVPPTLSAEALALLEAAGRDHLCCEARLLFARIVNELSHDDAALAAVQTGARAFVHEVKRAAEAIGLPRPVGEKGAVLSPVAAAHWDLFLEDLRYAIRALRCTCTCTSIPFLLSQISSGVVDASRLTVQ
jgi:hypothetical protein